MESIRNQVIRQTLIKIKEIVSNDINGNLFIIANRNKNNNFIRNNGLLFDDIKQIILNLEIADCSKGPVNDRSGYDGDVWIFEPETEYNKLYIKLRLEDNKCVICISIHENGLFN